MQFILHIKLTLLNIRLRGDKYLLDGLLAESIDAVFVHVF